MAAPDLAPILPVDRGITKTRPIAELDDEELAAWRVFVLARLRAARDELRELVIARYDRRRADAPSSEVAA